jgi:hypothetical protein
MMFLKITITGLVKIHSTKQFSFNENSSNLLNSIFVNVSMNYSQNKKNHSTKLQNKKEFCDQDIMCEVSNA